MDEHIGSSWFSATAKVVPPSTAARSKGSLFADLIEGHSSQLTWDIDVSPSVQERTQIKTAFCKETANQKKLSHTCAANITAAIPQEQNAGFCTPNLCLDLRSMQVNRPHILYFGVKTTILSILEVQVCVRLPSRSRVFQESRPVV